LLLSLPTTRTEEFLELQVPHDCGNGKWNCGLSLARLLWHVPIGAMLTLISAMLLERRIILVGQSRFVLAWMKHQQYGCMQQLDIDLTKAT
jgi:hypothetical protein